MAQAAVIALVLLVVGAVAVMLRSTDVSGEEARQLVADGALLLDVRTKAEFDQAHIPGAINISVAELKGRLSELGDKQRPVVVYCRSGNRSGRAKRMMEAAGFADVRNLGPMTAW